MTQLSLGQAAELTGKSKSTISRAIKSGRLSATRDGDRYCIDPAELSRVFNIATSATGPATVPQNDTQPPQDPSNDARLASLETENRLLREMLDRERETVDDLRGRLTRVQALIEDKRPSSRRPWRWPWSR